ncbi:MAG: hypothetical protein R2717_08380, partial [Schumannella sp.]
AAAATVAAPVDPAEPAVAAAAEPAVTAAPVAEEEAPVVPAKPAETPSKSTVLAVRAPEPAHLVEALPLAESSEKPAKTPAPRSTASRPGHRRVTQPATTSSAPAASAPATPAPATSARSVPANAQPGTEAPATGSKPAPAKSRRATRPAPHPVPMPAPAPVAEAPVEPVAATPAEPVDEDTQVTRVSHTLGTARSLDSAVAALPRVGEEPVSETTQRPRRKQAAVDASEPAQREPVKAEPAVRPRKPAPVLSPQLIERPIVIKPDPVRPSRFAPDPAKLRGAYAAAPAPQPGTAGVLPPSPVDGTVVNTVSIRRDREAVELATAPPPIRHILPRPTAQTIPPKEVEASRPEPVDDDPTAETAPEAELETVAIPIAGSLLGEIGGLPRVEVRTPQPSPITDTAPNPERIARESYERRARELERVAHERLVREQQRLALSIREQLAHDKRELESVLDNRLEDTVLRPRG